MKKVLFVQKVKEDKRNEYIKVHREPWKELLKLAKQLGIKRQIIWLYGNYILIYIMTENFDEVMAKLAEKRIFKKWNAKMEPLLDEMQDYSEKGKIIKLEKVFELK